MKTFRKVMIIICVLIAITGFVWLAYTQMGKDFVVDFILPSFIMGGGMMGVCYFVNKDD